MESGHTQWLEFSLHKAASSRFTERPYVQKKRKKLHEKISQVDIRPPHALANTLTYKHIYAQSKIRQKPAWWHTQFYYKGGEGKRILSSAWATETLTQKTTKGLERSLRH